MQRTSLRVINVIRGIITMIRNPNSWFTDSAIRTFGIPTQIAIRNVHGWLSGKHKTVNPEDIKSFDKAVEYARAHCAQA
nr:MAG TPA: hypothetical protein [Caudoviricetes sp.]